GCCAPNRRGQSEQCCREHRCGRELTYLRQCAMFEDRACSPNTIIDVLAEQSGGRGARVVSQGRPAGQPDFETRLTQTHVEFGILVMRKRLVIAHYRAESIDSHQRMMAVV